MSGLNASLHNSFALIDSLNAMHTDNLRTIEHLSQCMLHLTTLNDNIRNVLTQLVPQTPMNGVLHSRHTMNNMLHPVYHVSPYRRHRLENVSQFGFGSQERDRRVFSPNTTLRNTYNYRMPNFTRVLNEIFEDMLSVDTPGFLPTAQQISNATRTCLFRDIVRPMNATCSISLRDFSGEDEVTTILQCGHIFSKDSLTQWFTRDNRCPVCRYDIRNYVRGNNLRQEERRFPRHSTTRRRTSSQSASPQQSTDANNNHNNASQTRNTTSSASSINSNLTAQDTNDSFYVSDVDSESSESKKSEEDPECHTIARDSNNSDIVDVDSDDDTGIIAPNTDITTTFDITTIGRNGEIYRTTHDFSGNLFNSINDITQALMGSFHRF
jgi:hypothetical protein